MCIVLHWLGTRRTAEHLVISKKCHFMRIIHFMYTVMESDGLKGKGVRGHCEEHRVLSVLLPLLSPAFLHHC